MNERIKAARKALGLTMEQFGKRVGLSKSAISLIESGKNGTTEQTVASICREFGVNGMWLRTGEGEMFDQSTESSLDRLAAEYHLDEIIGRLLGMDAGIFPYLADYSGKTYP